MSIKKYVKGAHNTPMSERKLNTKIINPSYDEKLPLFEPVIDDLEFMHEEEQEPIFSAAHLDTSFLVVDVPGEPGTVNLKLKMLFDLEGWFKENNLHESELRKQFAKIKEEVDELEEALQKGDIEHIKEEAVDIVISTHNLLVRLDINFLEALQEGIEKVISRKGENINGDFVRSKD